MNKKQLTVTVAKEAGVSQVQAAKVINTALDAIAQALKAGNKVTLTGFGTFEVQPKRRSRTAQPVFNPGSKLKLPPRQAADERWEKSFAASIKELDQLSEMALAEHRAGRTRLLDPDKL